MLEQSNPKSVKESIAILKSVKLISEKQFNNVKTLEQLAGEVSNLIKKAIETSDQEMVERLCAALPQIISLTQDKNAESYSTLLRQVFTELASQVQGRYYYGESDDKVRATLNEAMSLMQFGYHDHVKELLKDLNSTKIKQINEILMAVSTGLDFRLDTRYITQIQRKLLVEIQSAPEKLKKWTLDYPSSLHKIQMVNDMYTIITRLEDIARYHPQDYVKQEALSSLQKLSKNNDLDIRILNRLKEFPPLATQSAPARLESNWSEVQPTARKERKEMLIRAKREASVSPAPSASPAAAATAAPPDTKWKHGKKPGE